MNNDLMKVFNNSYLYEKYKNVLDEPLNADLETKSKTLDEYVHYQRCCYITNNKIRQLNKNVMIKNFINCLYFVYTDFGESEFDNKYWFFIGKLSGYKEENIVYFSYEVGRAGTGFGFGETSIIHLADTKELLLSYGLTDKQRNLIISNIKLS